MPLNITVSRSPPVARTCLPPAASPSDFETSSQAPLHTQVKPRQYLVRLVLIPLLTIYKIRICPKDSWLSPPLSRSKIVFATCGILLEELRASGLRALQRWGCIILDEVHERFVESDLVLACIRLFVRNDTTRRLRIALMSATADFGRYQAWFKEALAPSDAVELIAIPDWRAALRGVLLQTQVKVSRARKLPIYDRLLVTSQSIEGACSTLTRLLVVEDWLTLLRVWHGCIYLLKLL
jgi:hypothetical protein